MDLEINKWLFNSHLEMNMNQKVHVLNTEEEKNVIGYIGYICELFNFLANP